jgi:hypothetical protein
VIGAEVPDEIPQHQIRDHRQVGGCVSGVDLGAATPFEQGDRPSGFRKEIRCGQPSDAPAHDHHIDVLVAIDLRKTRQRR